MNKKLEELNNNNSKENEAESNYDTFRFNVNVSELNDVIVIEDDTPAASLVNMLRQRAHHGGRGGSEVVLKSPTNRNQNESEKSREKPAPLRRNMTLALITLEKSPNDVEDEEVNGGTTTTTTNNNNNNNGTVSNSELPPIDENSVLKPEPGDSLSIWLLCRLPWRFLKERPLWRLFIIMGMNGLLSLASSALIISIEKPAQDVRLAERSDLLRNIRAMEKNITSRLETPEVEPDVTAQMIDDYTLMVAKIKDHPDEIKWDMLSAQAFITSVQTTTGYGDIVPVTTGGKMFTLAYALIGVPVFMWYIVKLGGLFRLLVVHIFDAVKSCLCPRRIKRMDSDYSGWSNDTVATEVTSSSGGGQQNPSRMSNLNMTLNRTNNNRRRSTFETIIDKANDSIMEQFSYDERFHPSAILVILLLFLFSVGYLISYMEQISYFDSLYACFVTYSTIGFGDIDIYNISYRSSWFNLLIYGNFIHILGYMILSAWIASILDKAGVRKF